MLGTLMALVVSGVVYWSGVSKEAFSTTPLLGLLLIGIPIVMLFFNIIVWVATWSPLQQAEQHLTSRVTELVRKDTSLRLSRSFSVIFPLISVFFVIDIWSLHLFQQDILLLIWLVLFGISIDMLHYLIRRVLSYLDPFRVLTIFTRQANKSIQNENELELCHWIDALAEIGVRAVERTSISLTNTVCNELQRIGRIFLESSKSIGHADAAAKVPGGGDEVSYTLFFLLQRLEIINKKAAEQNLETVCSNISSVVGKLILAAAKYDISLTAYPIRCLGKFALTAENKGLTEIGTRATYTLLEVGKGIITENDITYAELQEPFLSLIAQMNEIAREMFRQDKTISIKLLKQPFLDLKDLFTSQKLENHPDTPPILRGIDNAIAEFDALDTMLRAIPAIPPLATEG